MGAFTKRWLIRKRRTRKLKIDMLRRRYAKADSETHRSAILKKVHLVSPQMSVEDFLAPIHKNDDAKKGAKEKTRTTS